MEFFSPEFWDKLFDTPVIMLVIIYKFLDHKRALRDIESKDKLLDVINTKKE